MPSYKGNTALPQVPGDSDSTQTNLEAALSVSLMSTSLPWWAHEQVRPTPKHKEPLSYMPPLSHVSFFFFLLLLLKFINAVTFHEQRKENTFLQ